MRKLKKGGFIVKNNNKGIPMFGPGGQNPPKVYTDPIAYNKAAQNYNDSLALYNYSLQKDLEAKKYAQQLIQDNNSHWYNVNRDLKVKKMPLSTNNVRTPIIKLNNPNSNIQPEYINAYFGVPSNKLIRNAEEEINSGKLVSKYGKANRINTNANNLSANNSFEEVYMYSMPKQPVKYQPKQTTSRPPAIQTINTTQGQITGVVRPNQIKGSQLVMVMNPVRSKENLKRLETVTRPLTIPKVVPQGKLLPITPMQLPQQGNIPFYGPGNTIIGYTDDNRNFYPAQKYTGSPNNQVNLQDKQLLENPELLQQYVLKRDNYKFAKGGVTVNSNENIPTIKGPSGYINENGIWIPDNKTIKKQAQELGSKKIITEGGSLIIFDDNWNIVAADDNPNAVYKEGGEKNKFNTNLKGNAFESFNYHSKLFPSLLNDAFDYDTKGFYKEVYDKYNGDLGAITKALTPNSPTQHIGTDRYKKPNHPTFSNESKYAIPIIRPGGKWGHNEEEDYDYFKATRRNIKNMNNSDGSPFNYFKRAEDYNQDGIPDVKLFFRNEQVFKQGGSVVLNAGGEKHRIYVKTTNRGEGTKGHIMVNHPTMDKGMWDTIDLTEKAGAKTIAQGVAATKKWHKENPYKKQKGGLVNLNLPVFRMPEKKPFVFNKFLVNDRNQNLFIGGINPTYQNEKLSVGPYMVGVGNKYFQKFPADYGVRGNYNVNDNFNINMSVGKNNINAGINYKFRNGGKFLPMFGPGGKNDVVTPNNLEQLTSEYNIIQEQINKGDENKNAYLKNMRKIADDLIEKQFALEKSNVLPESILNWRGPNGEPSSYCIGTSCYLADLAGDKFYPENSSFFTSNSAAQDYAKNNPNATRYLEQDEKYIESGDILQFKSGKKGSPFHAFTVYDIGEPNKENYRPLTVVGSQGHGPIIKKTYFLGDDNKVYTNFEGFVGSIHDTQLLKRRNNNADYNSIVEKRNKLKEQITKLDPGYFIPKEDIRYNDYKQTIFSLNKDKLQANNERKGLQYVDTKNSKLEEIVNKYNDPNYKYNYMRTHNISSNEYDLAVSNMLGIYGAETKFGTDYTTKGKLPESPKLTKIANALGIIDQEKHSIGPFQITYNQLPESYRKTIKPKDLYNPMIGAEATMENIVEGLSLLRKRANTTKETATENNPLSQNINKQNYLEYLPYLHNMRKWLRGDNYTQEKYNSVLKGDSGYKQLVDDYRNNLLQISRTPLTTPEPLLIKNQKQEGGLFKESIGEWDYPRQSNIMSSKKEEIYSYKKGGQHGGLDRWFAEKWVDIKTGETCGRQKGEDRNYPACRPSKRVSSATPKTASELSSAEKERFKREKTSSKKISYQHNRK